MSAGPRPAATGRGVVVDIESVRAGHRHHTISERRALAKMPAPMRRRALARLAAARAAYDAHCCHMHALRMAGVL